MKTIDVDGRRLQYEVRRESCGCHTVFYEGSVTRRVRDFPSIWRTKWVTEPRQIFIVWRDVEAPYLSGAEVRGLIDHQLALLDRAKEVRDGHLLGRQLSLADGENEH